MKQSCKVKRVSLFSEIAGTIESVWVKVCIRVSSRMCEKINKFSSLIPLVPLESMNLYLCVSKTSTKKGHLVCCGCAIKTTGK